MIKKGFEVTVVDNSADMLAHIKDAETVCADIETLNLNKVFDAVLLMSFLINFPNSEIRQSLLETCKHHLKKDGVIIIECYPGGSLAKLKIGYCGSADGIEYHIDSVEKTDSNFTLSYRWETDGEVWKQTFETEILNEKKLKQTLLSAGLEFQQWIDDSHRWFTAAHIGSV